MKNFRVVTLFMAMAPAFLFAGDDSGAGGLEGTWRVEVTRRSCESGLASQPFQSLLTFARGGTLTGTTANPAFLAGQRSGDHGFWSPAGVRVFRAVDEAFILFDSPGSGSGPGFKAGTQQISQTIEMKNDDEFTSSASTSFFDVRGKLLNKGCASAIGHRLR
jgi:hypothetical protein